MKMARTAIRAEHSCKMEALVIMAPLLKAHVKRTTSSTRKKGILKKKSDTFANKLAEIFGPTLAPLIAKDLRRLK
jgi:hypothetical protein